MANAVEKALSDTGMAGIGTTLRGGCPAGAKAIHGLALRLSQTYVQWEHIEASLQTWREETDLALRPNYLYYKDPDTDTHSMHFHREPAVVATRKKHLRSLVAAIYTRQLKPSTANALSATYSLGTQGWYIGPG